MSQLSTESLFRAADPQTFGRALLNLDCVDDLRQDDGQVSGTVIHQGLTHRARLSNEEHSTWSCDCPEPPGNAPCLHAVLTGLNFTLGRHGRDRRPRPSRNGPYDRPFDHDGLMRRLQTGESAPEDPPLAIALLREVALGRSIELQVLFDEALDVFALPAEERGLAYLRALHAAAETIGQFLVNGQRMNGEDLHTTVSGYVEKTIDLIEDPDGTVAAAAGEIDWIAENTYEPEEHEP